MVDIPFVHGPGAVLGQGRCARVAKRQGHGQTVQKAVLVPLRQFIEGRRLPVVPQRQIPMVLPVQKIHRDSAVAVGQVVDAPCCAGRSCHRC